MSPSGPIESTFDIIRGVINEDVVKSTQGIYQFDLSGNSRKGLRLYVDFLWVCPSCDFFVSISGEHAGIWFLDLKNAAGSAGQGQPPVKADVVMTMDSSDFGKMFAGKPSTWCRPCGAAHVTHAHFCGSSCLLCVSGKLKPTLAFMSGKLRIKGDMTLAIKLEKLMGRMNKAKL